MPQPKKGRKMREKIRAPAADAVGTAEKLEER